MCRDANTILKAEYTRMRPLPARSLFYHSLLRWKWIFFHTPPSRFHSRVSLAVAILSPFWMTRTYEISAWSEPSMRTCGLEMLFCVGGAFVFGNDFARLLGAAAATAQLSVRVTAVRTATTPIVGLCLYMHM